MGGEMHALGLLLPYAMEGTKIHTEYAAFLCVGTAGPALPVPSVFAYNGLNINFKGEILKLKL